MDVEVTFNEKGVLRDKLYRDAVRVIIKRNNPPEMVSLEEERGPIKIEVSKEIKEKWERARAALELETNSKWSDNEVMVYLMNNLKEEKKK